MTVARYVQLDAGEAAHVLGDLLAGGIPVRLRAQGGSMSPWIRDGDDVRVEPIGGGGPRPGDVVAVRLGAARVLVVHRVVDARPGGLVTHGDRARAPDEPSGPGAVLGRVTRVERRGRRCWLPRGRLGLALAAASRGALRLRGWLRPARAGRPMPGEGDAPAVN